MPQDHAKKSDAKTILSPARNCPTGPDGDHEGYWIEPRVSFRCYHCGCQYHLAEMERPTPKHRIERWQPV